MFPFFLRKKGKIKNSSSEQSEQKERIRNSNHGIISFGNVSKEYFIVPIESFLRERTKGNMCICVCNLKIWVIKDYKDTKKNRMYFKKYFVENGVYTSKLYEDESGNTKETVYHLLENISDIHFV